MSRKRDNLRHPSSGQVAIEYAAGALFLTALCCAMLWMFNQMFVQGNLYGGGQRDQNRLFFLDEEDKSFGLERVVSLPFP